MHGANVLVAEEAVELDDELVLLLREVAALEVGPEVVDPPEAAALAAAEQAGGLGQRAPATLAVRLDVRDESVVLFLGPRALVGVRLLAARRPPHGGRRTRTKPAMLLAAFPRILLPPLSSAPLPRCGGLAAVEVAAAAAAVLRAKGGWRGAWIL
jgi:hypothetical protein